MLHVNDDMDLFRKAAENYPLNTSSHDWEQVRKKMEAAAAAKPKKPGSHRNRNFLLALLFLLIPLKILFSDMISPVSGSGIKRLNTILVSYPYDNAQVSYTAYHPTKTDVTNAEPDNTGKTGITIPASHSQKKSNKINTFLNPSKTNSDYVDRSGSSDLNLATASKTDIRITSPGMEEDGNALNTEQSNIETEPKTNATTLSEEINKEEVIVSNPSADKKDKKKKQKHFYAGIIAGPDLTSVKLQSVKKVGIGYGLIAGYRFNKWNIETGFIKDKKFYNTDGEHFNTKNLSLPNYVKINKAEGDCDMFEIPINVRYNFNRSGGWFASAGISSYLMKKEYYDYEISRYGSTYNRDYTYNESRSTFLAVCNISGGYSWELGKIGNLRIEPYIKLPLSKVGIGDLHLQSAGIYIGFTRFLF